MISPLPPSALRGAYVRCTLPPVPWAMLRLRNEHSRAFRGRYSPENSAWGVEVVESQYWPHVRSVDIIGPPQSGKTFHACELPTLYDLCEARETVFYMNGSEDNAKNLWKTRWIHSIKADPHLAEQLHERMDGGEWFERHFVDGGLLYSTGPASASALSQRESRIVRCSELEKTPGKIGEEASAYSLARDRAAAYPATHMIVSDCTITVRSGLSWKRWLNGDRSRYHIPCPHCGHYAVPAHQRHIDESELALTEAGTHLFHIPELAQHSAVAAAEQVQLLCRQCGGRFTDRSFRASVRAGVWVPESCRVERQDDAKKTPVPKVTWLDNLNAWVARNLANYKVEQGREDPSPPPEWKGPRLPDGVALVWTPGVPLAGIPASAERGDALGSPEPFLPAFQPDPRKTKSRSFWLWRIFAPKYTLGQVASEIVEGDLGTATGDPHDDKKQACQKCFVIPYVEPTLGANTDLSEDAVFACVADLARGTAPTKSIAVVRAIDIGENEVHWGIRSFTSEAESFLCDHGVVNTDLREARKESGIKYDPDNPVFQRSRRDAIYVALDKIMALYPDGLPDENGELHATRLTYIDSSHMSEEIILYCARYHFDRVRPVKGRGAGIQRGRRRANLAGTWNENSEKKALQCRDASGRVMRHQYFDPKDPRRVMYLDADFWKRETHNGILTTARAAGRVERPGEIIQKPWWYLHNGLAPKPIAPGSTLIQRQDRYITQVLAERWEEWENPLTKRMEQGWTEYQQANHLQDVEAYLLAAGAALGVLPRYAAKEPRLPVSGIATAAQQSPSRAEIPARKPTPALQPRPVRRSYG